VEFSSSLTPSSRTWVSASDTTPLSEQGPQVASPEVCPAATDAEKIIHEESNNHRTKGTKVETLRIVHNPN
jgi:hypothetical protein